MTTRAIRVALVAAAVVALISLAWAEGLTVGSKAPAFTLKTLAGKQYRLTDYQGKKVVILDFGRFTCIPCRSTLTDLQKIQAKYAGNGVQIFQVNLDGAMAGRAVPKGIADLGITFPILQDTDYGVSTKYKVETIPHLVLVDTQGRIRFTHTGYETGLKDKLIQQIDKYRPQ